MNTFSNGLFNEQAFSLTVNGRNLFSVLMLPDHPDEFARGYLATEAIIPADEIESIMIDGTTIGVLTRNPFKVLLPKLTNDISLADLTCASNKQSRFLAIMQKTI